MSNDPADVFQFIDMRGHDECWCWLGPWGGRPGQERRPYFQAAGRRTMAYRWVYELVHGITLARTQTLLHSCDNGGHPTGCCNPNHLRIGTHAENMSDMVTRERHGLPKFAVDGIRRLLSEGRTQQEIASLYGVSREAISAISTGRSHRAGLSTRVDGSTDGDDTDARQDRGC
jgi:hypothetical protein